jgi:serine O-acetyltransferase
MTSQQGSDPGIGSPIDDRSALQEIVDRLWRVEDESGHHFSDVHQTVPSRAVVVGIVEDLRSVLFPGYFGEGELDEESRRWHIGATLDRVRQQLREQVRRALCFVCEEPDPARCAQCEAQTKRLTRAFLTRLPDIRQLLGTDVQAAYTGDPAASSPSETILSYPGILAMTDYRIAHELHRLRLPLVPRMITEYAHNVTGIDIHPGTTIGDHFFIDHGTGVVIGETAVIGNRVRIYQGVTLGAKSFPLDEHGHPIKGIPRHPIVEDDVTIYSGATILGRITIGAGSIIGGNVWLTHDVPPGSRISQAEARQVEFVDGGGI